MADEANKTLDRLIDTLTAASTAAPRVYDDAISRELARERRQTAVQAIRDTDVFAKFRQEIVDGQIRIDTANKLLNLVNEIVTKVLL